MRNHLAQKITPYEVSLLLRKAFSNVASISKGASGFRATCIYPMNPDVFCEEDFLPSELPFKTLMNQQQLIAQRQAKKVLQYLARQCKLIQRYQRRHTELVALLIIQFLAHQWKVFHQHLGQYIQQSLADQNDPDPAVSSLDIMSKLIKLLEKTNTLNIRPEAACTNVNIYVN